MYITIDGNEVTMDQIKTAFAAGQAVLVHGRKLDGGGSSTGLALDGRAHDTRGECYSVWEESWTRPAPTLTAALAAARC